MITMQMEQPEQRFSKPQIEPMCHLFAGFFLPKSHRVSKAVA